MEIIKSNLVSALDILGYGVSKETTETPISEISIELKTFDNVLYGFTNNGYIRIKQKIMDVNEDFNITVDYNMFLNIVKSIKDETINLIKNKNILKIESESVKCKLNLAIDAHGKKEDNMISVIDTIIKDFPSNLDNTADISSIKKYFALFKTISNDDFIEPYNGIYFGNTIMVTNLEDVVSVDSHIFKEDALLSFKEVQLLTRFDNIEYTTLNRFLYIKSGDTYIILTKLNRSNYQYKDIMELFQESFNSSCQINGSELINALNIDKIFSTGSNLGLHFYEKGVEILAPNGEFNYTVSNNKCDVGEYLIKKDLIRKLALSKDEITIYYGNDQIIKSTSDDISGIFSMEAN